MTDVKALTSLLVLGVYFAVFLMLLRPGGQGPDMLTQAGLALAAVAGA